MSINPRDAQRIVKRVLGAATLEDVRVRLRAISQGYTRFAQGMPTQAGDTRGFEIEVTAADQGRHATVSGTQDSDAALAELVRQAEAFASVVPVDPEWMPPLSTAHAPVTQRFDAAISKMSAVDRATQVEAAIASAKSLRLEPAGYLEHGEGAVVVAHRAGLFAYERATHVSMSTTCRTSDGTGSSKAAMVSHRLGDPQSSLDGAELAREAAGWALQSRAPVALDPGRYTVVFTPQAVAELMHFFVEVLSHRAAVEGRSAFSTPGGKTRIGESLFDPRITIWSDPDDPQHPARKFTADGVVHPRVDWVAEGKLEALAADRYWAERAGVPLRPSPSSLHMKGGEGDLDALIAGVDRGVLVTSLWYNRMLDPQHVLATGLTRDGTFSIEKGKISRSIKNFRYNDSPLTLLKNVIALGQSRRAVPILDGVWVMPPMVVREFNFESVSEAV